MIRKTNKGLLTAAALLLPTALVAGCANGTDDRSGQQGVDLSTLKEGTLGEPDSGDPVEGGTLTWAAFAEPGTLDPASTIAALTTGGMEMLNIYDSLIRYDADEQEFVPQLAESLENVDDLTWTMTLRDGVTFSNGEPLDSTAVEASQERYAESGPESGLWKDTVADISTPDDLTVTYTLTKPWAQFPGILSTGPGMIVGPGAGSGDSFEPIGAGPFVLDERRPAESISFKARVDYWGGKPPLDGLKMVLLPDEETAMESMAQGQVDLAFVRQPDKVAAVLETDPNGYVNFTAAQPSALINASPGRPGADPRVRQAMQLAIDTDTLTKRAYDGAGTGSSTIFPAYSRWHGDAEGLAYDPEKAKKLLEEAKADGYDGKVTYRDKNEPSSRRTAVAIKAMWEAVGFDVETKPYRSVTELLNTVAVKKDYDVSIWGHSFREADPTPKMFAMMQSSGSQVYDTYTSSQMDALLDEFRQAPTFEAQHAVMQLIQEQVNKDVPFLVFGAFAELVTWNDDVHGVVATSNSMGNFGHAWKG